MTAYPVAAFVTPHGFGHGARAAALLSAWRQIQPELAIHLFTTAPGWLFAESGLEPFVQHPVYCDVGMVQRDALQADLAATVARLGELYPLDPDRVAKLAATVQDLGCRAVLCDIAPLGAAVARAAGLPAILVENFTWDYIYAGYVESEPAMAPYVALLADLLQNVDLHIQTAPVCRPQAGAVQVPPISRAPRTDRLSTRSQLGVAPDQPLILVTMGGAAWEHTSVEGFAAAAPITFLLPGQDPPDSCPPNLICLPRNSGFYHPDLIQACDGVAGKIGYSTLAEVYHAGVPYAYVSRARFRESAVLARFAQTHMVGFEIAEADFQRGSWLARAPELVALPRTPPQVDNGAQVAARHIQAFLADAPTPKLSKLY